jgi:F-type H+-transporting ATPase subunit a
VSAMIAGILPAAIDIHPGEHPEWHALGMTFNADTIWTTVVAGAIVVILGFLARHYLTQDQEDHIPSKLQLIWEAVVNEVQKQVEDNLGRVHPFVVPLAVALFFFILIANWLELIPSEPNKNIHLLPAPTADTNLTYAMAIMVMVGVWIYGIRQKGAKGYFSHFLEPYPILLPLNVLEELVKPVTLALRLFGNIFAGGIMLALIAGLTTWKLGGVPVGGLLGILFNVVWKLFDMAIGAIQAFIFALLTVLYFGMAGAGHVEHEEHDEHDEHGDAHDTDDAAADANRREAEPDLVG